MPEIETLDDENLDDIDETLTERLLGLTEMFPESVRNGTSTAAKGIFSSAKWLYKFTGKTCWILSTSFVILALPVIFEVERVQTEEAQLQQQRQILLGPGSTAGGMGLPPGYPAPQQHRS
ncbi:mitochondrial import receptor subunit TOM22 homolog [Porites lutea]|uniref:mitochondrial import receptor subunit TOM22 homolog n=1 Tax=Porites lutea TaxID=51062 RepID=UPI003CC554DE